MQRTPQQTHSSSHHYPHQTPPASRVRSQKLAGLITKFESLDLRPKGKGFSELEMQAVPLSLRRGSGNIDRDDERLVSGNKDDDLELALRDVDGEELERFADQLGGIVGTRSPERLKGQALRENSPRRLSQVGDLQSATKKREGFVPGNEWGAAQKKGIMSPGRLPLPTDAGFPSPSPTKTPNVHAKAERSMKLVGLRRESKIMDRIRMFDGPMDFPKEKASSLAKGPASNLSPSPKRLPSEEKRPELYTPSAVRNSYVQSLAAKTPTRPTGRINIMWTPASRDTRSRKKELYASPQSQAQGQTREREAISPLKIQPLTADQIHFQHALIQAWVDQSPITHRQECMKTPTPAQAIKGPDGFVTLQGERRAGSSSRSTRNERIRRMTQSRMEIQDKIGKAIEAKVGTIKSLDPEFMTSLGEDLGREEDDGAPLLERSPATLPPTPLMPSAGSASEQDELKPLLDKEMIVAPLNLESQKVKQTYQCCSNGSFPSRRASHATFPEKRCDGSNSSSSENGVAECRRPSKLADRIFMFEKAFDSSRQRTQTLPIIVSTTHNSLQPQVASSPVKKQFEYRPRVKTPDSVSKTHHSLRPEVASSPVRKQFEYRPRMRTPVFAETFEKKSPNPSVNGQRRRDSTTIRQSPARDDDSKLPDPPSQEKEIAVDLGEDVGKPEMTPSPSPELDAAIFKTQPKFNTTRVTMPHRVVPKPPEEPPKPVNVKSGGSLMDRIKIWENRSAMQNTGSPISNNGVSKSSPNAARSKMRNFSNSKSWIRAASTGKSMNRKEITDVVEEVGKEMNVPVVLRDTNRKRSVWEEKERMMREEDVPKPLTRVISKFHAVSGPSSRASRRSTIADIPSASDSRGLSTLSPAEESMAKIPDSKEVSGRTSTEVLISSIFDDSVLSEKSEKPATLTDLGIAGDGNLSNVLNVTPNEDEIGAGVAFETSSFSERFMKGLKAGKPRIQAESTTTMSMSVPKIDLPATIEIKKGFKYHSPVRSISRYPKIFNMQKGSESGGSRNTPTFGVDHESKEGENGMDEQEPEQSGLTKVKSWWSATTKSLSSSGSSEADDVGLKRLGRELEKDGDGDGDAWLGPKASRSTSKGSVPQSAMKLQSLEAIEVGSSSGSEIGPLRQVSSSCASAPVSNNLMLFPSPKIANRKSAPRDQRKSELASPESDMCSDTDIDEDEFEVIEELEGPMLLGRRVQSGMLMEPRPVRLLERERLVELCTSPEKWAAGVKKKGE